MVKRFAKREDAIRDRLLGFTALPLQNGDIALLELALVHCTENGWSGISPANCCGRLSGIVDRMPSQPRKYPELP